MHNEQHYDAVVIGSGQAAKPLAIALAEAGMKTALIERAHVGGSCINYGCTPTKTMAAGARVAYLARRAQDYGVHTGEIKVDMSVVRKRKEGVVKSFRQSGERSIENTTGLKLIRGEARFAGSHHLEINLQSGRKLHLSSHTIFINTGTRSLIPQLDGLEGIPFLDNASIMELDEVPDHLLVVGGGYIGIEFGQMFRRFGSRVTIIQKGDQLLAREDRDVAEEVAKILAEDGIEIVLEASATRVEQDKDRRLRLTVETLPGHKLFSGSHLLVAAGRKPNTEDLNVEAAGIKLDRHGYIHVNDRLETNVPRVYALGDVKGGPAFTHISYDDFRIVRTNLLKGGRASTEGRLVPYVVFMDPQLGRVGLTEREAHEQSRKTRVAKIPMTSVARAIETSETRGFMKAVVDADSEQILGCAVLGIEGGEIMSVLQVAMMGKLPYTAIRDGVFAHPTLAESLNTLFTAIGD